MVTTNVIKWDDTNNKLTAFCSDDTGETEIGPCKWDDTNNRLEINCNSVDAIVKWDDTGNNLESRTTDDGCCEEYETVESGCCGDDCATAPKYLQVVFSGITRCGDYLEETWGDCCCDTADGTYILEFSSGVSIGGCGWYYQETPCGDSLYRYILAYINRYLLGSQAQWVVLIITNPLQWPRCFEHLTTPKADPNCTMCDDLPLINLPNTNAYGCDVWPDYCNNSSTGTATLSVY